MPPISIVYLEKCENYETQRLKQFFDRCFAEKDGISWRTAKVFIKPNLISARFSGPACTDPRFIYALAEWFVDSGCRVAVGDSPAIGKASSVLHKLRIDTQLRQLGVEILDFNKTTKVKLSCGYEVGIAAEPLEFDYFINAPKMKAHSQMYVTLAVKNIFGIVKGMRKSMLHMRHGGSDNTFSQIILDLLPLLPYNFSIIDGIEAMSRQGPLHGDTLNLGCLGFAKDPVALDTAIIAALQLNYNKSKLWVEAKRRKLPGASLDAINFPVLRPDNFHPCSFEAPDELAPIRFNPFRFLKGNLMRLRSSMLGQ